MEKTYFPTKGKMLYPRQKSSGKGEKRLYTKLYTLSTYDKTTKKITEKELQNIFFVKK